MAINLLNISDIYNSTTIVSPVVHSVLWGYFAVGLAVTFFGSNFVPVKKFETGDGMFFQWVLCSSIWIVGLVNFVIRGYPEFHWLAMIGGLLWCSGNVLCVPIIQTIGLGQGLLIWASVNLIVGWASSRFGWFGTTPKPPNNAVLNYIGVTLCVISAFIYMFLKTNTGPKSTNIPANPIITIEMNKSSSDTYPNHSNEKIAEVELSLIDKSIEHKYTNAQNPNLVVSNVIVQQDQNIYEKIPPITKRILGSTMACISGVFFGLTFIPVIYKKDTDPTSSQIGFDYVFPHFCGIFLTSSIYFFTYCVIKCNKPSIYPSAILPAMVSGLMWGSAAIAWFYVNDVLSEPISFPIITTLPGLIAAIWGVGFKEISGKRNFLILGVAVTTGLTGSILTGLSKL